MVQQALEDFALPPEDDSLLPPQDEFKVRPPRVRIPTALRYSTDPRWNADNDFMNRGEADTGLVDYDYAGRRGMPNTPVSPDKYPLPGMLSQRESSVKQEDWKKALDDRFRQGERSREPYKPTPWTEPDWMNDSTPPSIDPETAAAKERFQSFVRGVPQNQPTEAQDAAGRQSSADFWKNIWENPVTNNAVTQAATKQAGDIFGGIGEGFSASGEVTEGGLGTIQAADLLARKNKELAGGNRMPSISQMGGRATPRTTEEAAAMGAKSVQKEELSQDELNRLNSFLHNVGAISQETNVSPDDWRVIMESSRRMRAENPSAVDTIASFAADPTNLPFAAIGAPAKAISTGVRDIAGAATRRAGGAIEDIIAGGADALRPPTLAFADFDSNALKRAVRETPDSPEAKVVEIFSRDPKVAEEFDALLKEAGPGQADVLFRAAQDAIGEGKSAKQVLKDLQAGKNVFNQGETAAEITAAQAKAKAQGKELATVRARAKKVGEDPASTQAERTAAQEAVVAAEGKVAQPGTGGALKPFNGPTVVEPDAGLEWMRNTIKNDPKISPSEKARLLDNINKQLDIQKESGAKGLGQLTPEQIDEAKAPIAPPTELERALTNDLSRSEDDIAGEGKTVIERILGGQGGDIQDFGGGDSFPGMGFASKGGERSPGFPRGQEPGRQAADERAAAKLKPADALEAIVNRKRVDQATIFGPGDLGTKGRFTKPGQFPKGMSKKQQAQANAKAQLQKPVTYDVPGDLTGVGDIEQAMIDSGVRTKGFDIVGTMGAIGSTALRAPRELAASGDISGSFRQGLIGAIMHNNEWRKAFGHQMDAFSFTNDEGLKRVAAELQQLPSYEYGKSVGLASDINPGAAGSAVGAVAKARSAGYEAFTNAISRDVPGIGGLVRASDQAYEAFLGSLRANIFDTYSKSWGLMDMDRLAKMTPKQIENNRREATQLASFINSITGYGDLGIIERNPGLVDALNKGFFSPRFFASRINNIFSPLVLGIDAVAGRGSGKVARLALRDMAGFYSTMAAAASAAKFAGADVDFDPRSSGFGRIRLGDHVIDLSGGMNRTMAAMFQLFVAHGRKAQVTGREIDYANPSAIDRNGFEEAMNYLRQKTNVPVASFIDAGLTGNRNVVGEDRGVTANIPVPIGLSNVLDAAYHDLKKHGLADALKSGIATAALEGIGFSANTYERGPKPDVTDNPIDRGISNLTGIGRPRGKGGRRALEAF